MKYLFFFSFHFWKPYFGIKWKLYLLPFSFLKLLFFHIHHALAFTVSSWKSAVSQIYWLFFGVNESFFSGFKDIFCFFFAMVYLGMSHFIFASWCSWHILKSVAWILTFCLSSPLSLWKFAQSQSQVPLASEPLSCLFWIPAQVFWSGLSRIEAVPTIPSLICLFLLFFPCSSSLPCYLSERNKKYNQYSLLNAVW